jgi:SagB-type dehydrogenase family enzyme
VVARRVRGLTAGIYHYSGGQHELVRLSGRVTSARLRQYLPRSEYFAEASALVFFTALFARQLWRYPYSRAYRAALIEAGHVCQTFLLTATALHLAPFSLMGLADTPIEQDLGIDGITESVLYVAGIGHPPSATLALLPRGSLKLRRNPRFL